MSLQLFFWPEVVRLMADLAELSAVPNVSDVSNEPFRQRPRPRRKNCCGGLKNKCDEKLFEENKHFIKLRKHDLLFHT
jgi:hypothetical protein